MTAVHDLDDAKTSLSQLVDRAAAGEEIAVSGLPSDRLTELFPSSRPELRPHRQHDRNPGFWRMPICAVPMRDRASSLSPRARC